MTALHSTGDVCVIFEGAARPHWIRREPKEWYLRSIWPSSRQRDEVLSILRLAHPILIVQRSFGLAFDAFEEELSSDSSVSRYVVERDAGISSLYIPTMDYLPEAIRTEALSFLRETIAIQSLTDSSPGAILTPKIGLKRNVRVAHIPDVDSPLAATDLAARTAGIAFPTNHTRKGYSCQR